MTEVIVSIIGACALVLAAIVPVVLGLRKARVENREQHADNKQQFQENIGELKGMVHLMHEDVRDIRTDFVGHLKDHGKE
jgi:hypothetical protein